MGYNPFCQYYRHQGIPQPSKPRAGLQSLFPTHQHQEMIRIHECYHPENLDATGKLHSASWTYDQKIDCQFKGFPAKK